MGGVNKGLQMLRGRPMVQWVADRYTPQVDELLVNANQDAAAYEAMGFRVVSDIVGGYAGPLAGLHRGLSTASHPLVATVPCDSPFLPTDLVSRLYAAMQTDGTDFAVACTEGQPQPVFALCRRTLLGDLTAYLDAGGRKIDAWYGRFPVSEVLFDDAAAFRNINTAEELAEAASGLQGCS